MGDDTSRTFLGLGDLRFLVFGGLGASGLHSALLSTERSSCSSQSGRTLKDPEDISLHTGLQAHSVEGFFGFPT